MNDTETKPQEPHPAPATNPAENPPADNPTPTPAAPPVEAPANPADAPEPAHPEHQRAEGMRMECSRITEIQKITRAAMLPNNFAWISGSWRRNSE